MTRVRTLLTIIPAMLVGGLLFGSAFSRADSGGSFSDWPQVAQAEPRQHHRHASPDPWPAAVPTPPAPPAPPVPPTPPPGAHGHGMSVSIHDGEVRIDGLEDMIGGQLDALTGLLDSHPDLPKDAREKIRHRIEKVRQIVRSRLGVIKHGRLDKIAPEMERMGDEIEQAMDGLDDDLSSLGDKVGRDFAKRFGKDFAKKFKFTWKGRDDDNDTSSSSDDSSDDDEDAANVTAPTGPVDPYSTDDEDLGDAVAGIKSLTLTKDQKAELVKARVDSEQKIAVAKQQLEEMSNHLHDTLADTSASEADIERQIDDISHKEAAIRKARILAWVKVRKLLDPDQRKLVETAAKKHH